MDNDSVAYESKIRSGNWRVVQTKATRDRGDRARTAVDSATNDAIRISLLKYLITLSEFGNTSSPCGLFSCASVSKSIS